MWVPFTVAIPDQEPESCYAIAEVDQEVACLLGAPGSAGVRRDAEGGGHPQEATGGVLHDEQHGEPVEQERVNADEVGGENAVCLSGQEPLARWGRCGEQRGRCRLA
jgi:hypothetical protein